MGYIHESKAAQVAVDFWALSPENQRKFDSEFAAAEAVATPMPEALIAGNCESLPAYQGHRKVFLVHAGTFELYGVTRELNATLDLDQWVAAVKKAMVQAITVGQWVTPGKKSSWDHTTMTEYHPAVGGIFQVKLPDYKVTAFVIESNGSVRPAENGDRRRLKAEISAAEKADEASEIPTPAPAPTPAPTPPVTQAPTPAPVEEENKEEEIKNNPFAMLLKKKK